MSKSLRIFSSFMTVDPKGTDFASPCTKNPSPPHYDILKDSHPFSWSQGSHTLSTHWAAYRPTQPCKCLTIRCHYHYFRLSNIYPYNFAIHYVENVCVDMKSFMVKCNLRNRNNGIMVLLKALRKTVRHKDVTIFHYVNFVLSIFNMLTQSFLV